jgi:general secretion pathway protein D
VSIRPQIICLSLLVVLLAGCQVAPGTKADAVATELASPPPSPDTALRIAEHDDANPINIKGDDKEHSHSKAQVQPGSGKFIDEQAARAGIAAPKAAEGQITMNFENTPIQAVTQDILGSMLKENYTISPNVTGNVTFSTAKPITNEQAMPILEMLLAWTNNTLVRKEGRYEVLPIKDAIPGNLTPRIAPPNIAQGYEVRVFPLKYISATEMQKLLKPFAKADAVVSADSARNMIILAGTASELANYQRSIEVFDVDWLKGMSVGVYSLRNTDVTKIMPELDKIFGTTGESPLAGMFRFIPMETTNSIVVITPQPDYLKQAESWLYRLDTGVGENGTQLYVYDVKNVKAVDLSDHLNAIFTGRTSSKSGSSGNVAPGLKAVTIGGLGGGIGGSSSGTNSAMSLPGSSTNQGRSTTATGTTGGSNLSTTGSGSANAAGQKETDIRITPIEENNQLLVMATPGEWDSILSTIRRLDISPLQVQIETRILEVTLTGDFEFGVQWWLAGLANTNTTGSSTSTGYQYGPQYQPDPSTRARASLGAQGGPTPTTTGGLFYSFLNKNYQVALNALQTSGNTKTLSAPSMVVMNNQEAQINVGTQVPVNTTSIVGLTGTTGAIGSTATNTGISSASYINTGVVLDVKPRVNPGGLVYMDISQEVSSPGTPAAAGDNPPINQRQLQTQVAVQSGETVLLGGLIQETDTTAKTGLPILSSVPFLGNLFGSTSKTRTRTELIVLITPRVVTNPDEAREMTTEYEKKFESLAPMRAKEKQAAEKSGAVPTPAPAPAAPNPEQLIPEQPKTEGDKPGEK